jgi:hypothetical protein
MDGPQPKVTIRAAEKERHAGMAGMGNPPVTLPSGYHCHPTVKDL